MGAFNFSRFKAFSAIHSFALGMMLSFTGTVGLQPAHAMLSVSKLPHKMVAAAVGGSDVGVVPADPSPQDAYQSRKMIYAMISSGNCATSTTGTLFNCRFPEISFNEGGRRLPPLPYETKVQVKVTPTCRGKIEPAVASLNFRLGQFVVRPGQGEEDDFYRSDVLNFSQSQIRSFSHSQSYPIKSLRVAPKESVIFESAVFPADCEVTLEIEPNRIAVKTISEAGDHLTKVGSQLILLTHLSDALLELRTCRTESEETSGMLAAIWKRMTQTRTRAETCRVQWGGLQKLTSVFEQQMRQNAVLSADPQVQGFVQSFQALSKVLSQHLAAIEIEPEKLGELLSQTQAQNRERHQERFDSLLNPEYLRQIGLNLVNQQTQVELARYSLTTLFEDSVYPGLLEDLSDLSFEEISGPHGTVDSIVMGMRNIAPATHRTLPRE